jgi:DNA-binding GntR family transcriptional regulator
MTTQFSADDPRIWVWIARDVITSIENGHLKPGDKMPSGAELAEQYECHVTTAYRALHKLAHLGFISGLTGERCRSRVIGSGGRI